MCDFGCEMQSAGSRVGLLWQLLLFAFGRSPRWLAVMLLLVQASLLQAQYDINGFNFHIYDMFDDKLMPMQILSQQQLDELFRYGNSSTRAAGNSDWPYAQATETLGVMHSADFGTALCSMDYHRRMMNEFMVTDYITHQILREENTRRDQQPLDTDGEIPIEKRMGAAKADATADAKHANTNSSSENANTRSNGRSSSMNANSNHKLLNDEGMTRYKTWLKKYALLNRLAVPRKALQHHGRSTTLKDIQSQLETKQRKRKHPHQHATAVRRHSQEPSEGKMDFSVDYPDEELDFEDGDITGYAMTSNDYINPQYATANRQHWPLMAANSASEPVAPVFSVAKTISKNGYESGYEDYGTVYHGPSQHVPPIDSQHTPAATSKEISIKDITDIALTTLAFLSFGMFILQVLMCITMGKDDTSNLMMMPMEAAETSEQDGVEEVRRRRRSAPNANYRLMMMNELARRVLFSIDAALLLPKDEGVCNYWSLCDNIRFARKQKNGQKYWIPIWSLGMSWFTSRIQNEQGSNGDYMPIMRSLRAIITGLANGDCETVYTHACNKAKIYP